MRQTFSTLLKSFFSPKAAPEAPAVETAVAVAGVMTPQAFYGFQGRVVSAEDNKAITGLEQNGIMVGLHLPEDQRMLVFIPEINEAGQKNQAFESLMSQAFTWATGPSGERPANATFTGQRSVQDLPAAVEGAKTFFVADRSFSVQP